MGFSPWSSNLSTGFLSDISVQISGATLELHRFPLFSRSKFFAEKCQEERDKCHFLIDLEQFPGGSAAFRHVTRFCYSESPSLDPSTVFPILLAAENLKMTETHSPHNLIQECEDFLKNEVFVSWEKSLTVLESTEDDLLKGKRAEEVDKACQDVIVGAALKLVEVEKLFESLLFFKALVKLPHPLLQKLLNTFRESSLPFVVLGNHLSKQNYHWFLSEVPEEGNLGTENGLVMNPKLKKNSQSILEFLVEALEISRVETEPELEFESEISYMVTLLKYSCELQCEVHSGLLEGALSKRLHKLTLEDLKVLKTETVQSLVRQFSDKISENKVSSEDKLTVANLIDSFLFWGSSESENCHLFFQSLLESLPKTFRSSCDVLYDAIDNFLKNNNEISVENRSILCSYIDPFQISESRAVNAVRNERITLGPDFFKVLYLMEREKATNLESKTTSLEEMVETQKLKLKELNDEIQRMPFIIKIMKEVVCDFSVYRLAFAPDGKLWGGWDALVCWEKDQCVYEVKESHFTIWSLAVSEEGLIWAGCKDGTILVVENFKVVGNLKAHKSRIFSLLSIHGNRCIAGDEGGEIKEWFWDGKSLSCVSTFENRKKIEVLSLKKDAKGRIWSSSNGTIQCWENNTCVKIIEASSKKDPQFFSEKFKSDTKMNTLVVGDDYFWSSGKERIFCWTVEGEYVHDWEAHGGEVEGLSIDREGVVWSASTDKTVRAWRGPWKTPICVAHLDVEENLYDLIVTRDDEVWVASDKKVIMLKRSYSPL